MRRSILPVLGLAVLTACADDPTSPAESGPIHLTVAAAAGEFVACGAEVPLTVTVLNDRNRPVSGYLLNFNVLEGGGSVFGGAALSNNKGVAKDIWTVGRLPNALNTLAIRSVDPVTGVGTTHATRTVRILSRIAFSRFVGDDSHIYTIAANGEEEVELTTGSTDDRDPAWSPDGGKIAFMRTTGTGTQIVVMNADGGEPTPLTTEGYSRAPSWSPDGRKIVFAGTRTGDVTGLYVVNRDGTGETPLAASASGDRDPAWSPDGRSIAFVSSFRPGGAGIFVMNADGTGEVMRLTSSGGADDGRPAWSPDSRKLVFHRGVIEDNLGDIFVINADGTNETRLAGDGTVFYLQPSWSPDGGQIVFSSFWDQGLFIMNADGTEITRLTPELNHELGPSWAGACAP